MGGVIVTEPDWDEIEVDPETERYVRNRRYLDGARLIEWLQEIRPEVVNNVEPILGEAMARRIYDWRHGATANYQMVDRLLTRLGLNLDADIPDDCWLIGHSPKGRRSWPPETRQKAERLIRRGKLSPRQIADKVGVHPRTIQNWKLKMEEAEIEAERMLDEVNARWPGEER